MGTVQSWGYRHGEAKIFDVPADNPVLPPGWYDSPAKVPTPAAASDPPPPPTKGKKK